MMARVTQLSVVILGTEHNPTILNPNFLEDQGIVPSEWNWKLSNEPPLTTPPLSRVSYSNGVLITVQREKLQITDNLLTDRRSVTNSKAPEIALKYIKELPHVKYRAVGINVTAVMDSEEPGSFLIDRFLKDGAWLTTPNALADIGLRFGYPLDNGRAVFSLEAAMVETDQEKRASNRVIIAAANFHRDCNPPSYEQVEQHLSHLMHDWDMFKMMVQKNIGVEI